VVVNVVATEQTGHGEGGSPGYLQGHGLIDCQHVRAMARDGLVRVADPVSPAEALRYQPRRRWAVRAIPRCRASVAGVRP
jgi:hypothetical protein